MDIVSRTNLKALMLDAVARAALGAATCGVSVGGGRSRIHLMNDNPPEQQRASDVLNHFGTLPISADLTRKRVGDADPIISCRDELIAKDDRLAYIVLRNDAVLMRGRANLTNGQLSLSVDLPEAGTYDIFLYRLAGNFASGDLRIKVDAAETV